MATRSTTRKPKTAAADPAETPVVETADTPAAPEAAPVKKPRTRKPKAAAVETVAAVAETTAEVSQETADPSDAADVLSEDERQRRIAEAAYFIAERRGFAPGNEADDWLQAEAEVNQSSKAETV